MLDGWSRHPEQLLLSVDDALWYAQSPFESYNDAHTTSKLAAFVLIVAFGVTCGSTTAYYMLARRTTLKQHAHTRARRQDDDRQAQRTRMLLELTKVVMAATVLAVTVTKLVIQLDPIEDQTKHNTWTVVMDVFVIVIALYIAASSFVSVVYPTFARTIRSHQWTLFLSLVIALATDNIVPFVYRKRPPITQVTQLGFAQTAIVAALVLVLLLTPPHWQPVLSRVKPNPAQIASPLSNLFFAFLETRMWRWFLETTKQHSSNEFLSFVPVLPDYLHSRWILSKFRWRGDQVRDDDTDALNTSHDEDDDDETDFRDRPPTGAVYKFMWTFRLEFVKIFAFATVWVLAIFVSPLSMNLLLRYVQDNAQTTVSPYLFVFGIFLAPIVSSVAFQCATYRISQIGLRLRSLLGHAVYAKLLRVKAGGGGSKQDDEGQQDEEEGGGAMSSGGNEAIGRVNNLVGTDIDVITSSLTTALQLFGVLPKLVVSLVFLYVLLGWSAFVALGAIVAFAPVSTMVSKKYGGVQEEIMKATDTRITIVGELVSSIRVLKMLNWGSFAQKRIYDARQTELGRITKRAKVYAGLMFLSTGIPAAVTLTTFGAYVFGMKQTLTASTAFTSMSLFGLLREAVISSTYLLSAFMRARVSLGRITRFLVDTEELDNSPRKFEGDEISINNAKFKFSKYGKDGFTLDIDSLKIPTGKTTIIAGDVGSGKSALLNALLGEMHLNQGQVKYPARVKTSFAAQAPWLQDDSVRANILFGNEWNEDRYYETLFACALESDIEGFPDGDETRVGEKGLSMSGGQKQRIALARAVYAKTDIVLLDDVLSAVDSNTAAHLVENCLNGPLLKGRTVVLVTHFVKMCTRRVNNCELVVHLHEGRIKKQGPPERGLAPEGAGGAAMGRTSSQSSLRSTKKEGNTSSDNDDKKGHQEHYDEGNEGSNDISFKVYKRYFAAFGKSIKTKVVFWIVYAIVNVVAHVLMLSQGWFVGRWVSAGDRDQRPGFYFTIYTVIQLSGALSLTAMYLMLIWGAINASRTIHERLTRAVFGAPFRFFDATPQGAILNRFSKDCEILDTEQVENLQPVLDYSVQVLFVAIIITVILPVFLLPAAVICLTFFFIGKVYVRNALAARKQVAAARSPLFSTLGDTTSGVVTIRAFDRTRTFAQGYLEKTDRYNQMQLYEDGLDRWLEERSDIVGALVSFIVGLLSLRGGLSAGTTGFLVSTGLEFTSRILYVVRAINKNELSMNSVQRILSFSDVDQETPPNRQGEPPANWPQGEIDFKDYSAKYSESGADVLHHLSLKIRKGERVGIVGPSGCGKSSLSLALLRFIVRSSGDILIDGRSVEETNLDALRSRVTLIPQEPILFSGTLRSNLDPDGEYDDQELWQAIQRSGFAKQGDQGTAEAKGLSLDTVVQSSGSNFSQGQRQLLSLARALVRSSKILILDEATASLDNESDRTMQKVIREEFDDCTNLTIAHRLETVIDYDRILVLDSGKIVEYDSPSALLNQPNSRFRALCEASGDLEELKKRARVD
ncbi:hypothetical protein OIO90_003704 [Microbotryomycetes sp. JL221]|nr:hypothetical protein OIO90_003704 [Microbotryomycetes sp. JL221]